MDAALSLVGEQVLGGADVADSPLGSAKPVAQIVQVVRPLDVELGGTLATGTTIRSVGVDLRFVQILGHRRADHGEQQEHDVCFEKLKEKRLNSCSLATLVKSLPFIFVTEFISLFDSTSASYSTLFAQKMDINSLLSLLFIPRRLFDLKWANHFLRAFLIRTRKICVK